MSDGFWVWGALVATAFFSAAGSVSAKYLLREKIHVDTVYSLRNAAFAVSAGVIVFMSGRESWAKVHDDVTTRMSLRHWALLLLLPLCMSFTGFWFLYAIKARKISVLSPTRTAMAVLLTIIGGALLLREKLNRYQWVAMSLMLLGFVLLVFSARNR